MKEPLGRRKHVSWVARDQRLRALLGVALGLALLVIVNAVVRQPSGGAAGGQFVGAFTPVVQMTQAGRLALSRAFACRPPAGELAYLDREHRTSAVKPPRGGVANGAPEGRSRPVASISRARFQVWETHKQFCR